MHLSKSTYAKLVNLVDALAEEYPRLDRRIKCAALQIKDGQVFIRMRGLGVPELERWFWTMLKHTQSGCWEWTGTKDDRGYGRFKAIGDRVLAHRAALVYVTGNNPAHLCACHRCHNPSCCSPFHLYWGTHRDNSQDMWQAGRGVALDGESNPNHKLTLSQVQYLRSGIAPLVDLARHVGIDYHHAWKIASGRSWKKTHPDEKL